MALPEQRAALRIQVAQEGAARAPGEKGRGERLQLLAEGRPLDDVVAVDEREQQHGGLPFTASRQYLRNVDRQVEVAGAAWDPLGLGPEDPVVEPPQPDHVLGRLDADAHLVAIVGPRGLLSPWTVEPTTLRRMQPPSATRRARSRSGFLL